MKLKKGTKMNNMLPRILYCENEKMTRASPAVLGIIIYVLRMTGLRTETSKKKKSNDFIHPINDYNFLRVNITREPKIERCPPLLPNLT